MNDDFTERFGNDAAAFRDLHEGLMRKGYVTEDESPWMNRSTHNSLSVDRYREMFEAHYQGQYTEITVLRTAFDIGDGFPSLYVAFDNARFEDKEQLQLELQRIGILR
jgi:hypothetical protein